MNAVSFIIIFGPIPMANAVEEKEEIIHRLRMKVKVGKVLCFIA
jgi:hypothetical protein